MPLLFNRTNLLAQYCHRKACGPYAIDSNGYKEIRTHGRYLAGASEYAVEVDEWIMMIGRPDFVAIQDWTCCPESVKASGKSVEEHQKRTLDSYLALKSLSPSVPWMPTIQGFTESQYLGSLHMHLKAGVNLIKEKIVGIGSVCRLQCKKMIGRVCRVMQRMGIRLHGFGFKFRELIHAHDAVETADSAAWVPKIKCKWSNLGGCEHRAKCCKMCFALKWREKLLSYWR